jgi:hypothetical protein
MEIYHERSGAHNSRRRLAGVFKDQRSAADAISGEVAR